MEKTNKQKLEKMYKNNDPIQSELLNPDFAQQIMDVKIPRIDTSVKALLGQNIYQSPNGVFAGELQDYSYTSTQDQRKILDDLKSQNLQQELDRLTIKPDQNNPQSY